MTWIRATRCEDKADEAVKTTTLDKSRQACDRRQTAGVPTLREGADDTVAETEWNFACGRLGGVQMETSYEWQERNTKGQPAIGIARMACQSDERIARRIARIGTAKIIKQTANKPKESEESTPRLGEVSLTRAEHPMWQDQPGEMPINTSEAGAWKQRRTAKPLLAKSGEKQR
ncbi:hypothetical protein R1flu_010746 [Riccia fluitans]|uniref:Uncharacterized protein n=1 Tax=Riccia fluitans TaxID=41844 RepID=A0ABD1Z8C2_9MARC